MTQNHPFGSHLIFEDAPVLEARVFGKATVTVAHLDQRAALHHWRESRPREDALLLSVQLRDTSLDGGAKEALLAEPRSVVAGDTFFHYLHRDPLMELASPFDCIDFHIPRGAFEALEEETHSPPTGEIRFRPGVPHADQRILALASILLPDFAAPGCKSRLLAECIATALVTHLASHYGNFLPGGWAAKGGLAPWQVRRAQEMLTADLEGGARLDDVARECGLSVGHFSRQFRATIGLPPHRWLIQRRIESAKLIMRQGKTSLSEIAIRCGFSDQSHFTRIFSRETGASPNQWLRCVSA